MIEMGQYQRCIEICDIALSVDAKCPKALYRKGLSHYRLSDHSSASPYFEAALRCVREERQRLEGEGNAAEAGAWLDLDRRISVYLGHIRRYSAQEKARCQKMFDQPLYKDRPDVKETTDEPFEVDDSDEAIEAALARRRGQCCSCLCRRRAAKSKTE